MIATTVIERCLDMLVQAANRMIGVVERVPGKGPGGAISEYGDNEYGCDEAPEHWNPWESEFLQD